MPDSFAVCKQDPSNANIHSILSHQIPLSPANYESGTCKESFSHYYDHAEQAIHDFSSWLRSATNTLDKQVVETVRQLKSVWTLVDPTMSLFPQSLLTGESIETCYFSRIFQIMKRNRKRPIKECEPCATPSTVKKVLIAIQQFLRFSVGRQVFVGIKKSEIDVILIQLKRMTNVLKPDSKLRKREVKQQKAETLITPADTINWGRSQFIQSTREAIKLIRANPTGRILPVVACDIRYYQMV